MIHQFVRGSFRLPFILFFFSLFVRLFDCLQTVLNKVKGYRELHSMNNIDVADTLPGISSNKRLFGTTNTQRGVMSTPHFFQNYLKLLFAINIKVANAC